MGDVELEKSLHIKKIGAEMSLNFFINDIIYVYYINPGNELPSVDQSIK